MIVVGQGRQAAKSVGRSGGVIGEREGVDSNERGEVEKGEW